MAGGCGQRPPPTPASESACFESHPVPIGLHLHGIRYLASIADWGHVLPSDWGPGCQSGNEEKALSVAVSSNLQIRSSAYPVLDPPRYLLPSESSRTAILSSSRWMANACVVESWRAPSSPPLAYVGASNIFRFVVPPIFRYLVGAKDVEIRLA